MFIQLHDVITDENPKTAGLFILTANNNKNKIFISRSFADRDLTKYTSTNEEHALVYFHRQAAIEAINTNFNYTGLALHIERIAVSENAKVHAKNTDTIKKLAKNESRRKRDPKPWK